ncbi:MAG TPA: hypothetical protein VNI77_09980, partial [Nitrososphaera sp.]|nr:hypothetical protein [Nitrososphaera sp.]
AIGKEGQNARLAAKLTSWRIDIKPESAVGPIQAIPAPEQMIAEEEQAAPKKRAPKAETPSEPETLAPWMEVISEEEAEGESVAEVVPTIEEPPATEAASQDSGIRFAEDIFGRQREGKKKAKKTEKEKEAVEVVGKVKRAKKVRPVLDDDEIIDEELP